MQKVFTVKRHSLKMIVLCSCRHFCGVGARKTNMKIDDFSLVTIEIITTSYGFKGMIFPDPNYDETIMTEGLHRTFSNVKVAAEDRSATNRK